MSLLASFKESLAAIGRSLLVPGFYMILLASLALWALAYQQKAVYVVDVGGLTDDAFQYGFHGKERNDELTYRWSRGVSTLTLPGIGNQPVMLSVTTIGFRPSGEAPALKLEVRGQTFTIQTEPIRRTDTVFVERGDAWDGDFKLLLSSPTFTPPNDPRELGVILDSVVVAPATYGIRPFVIPPVGTLGGLLFGIASSYLLMAVTMRRRLYGLALMVALSLLVASLVIVARPELGLLAGQVPSLALWGLGLALVGRATLDVLLPRRAEAAWFAVGVGSAAFVLAFLLRFGGLTYPQFLTSDLLLHVHLVQNRVLAGQLVFPGFLPDGTRVPYPPAFYILVAPLTGLLGSGDEPLGLILKWSGSVLDALTCLALAWAGARLWNGYGGGLAALLYAISPAPFELFSAGNYSNLFSQSVLNLTLVSALVFLGPGANSRSAVHDSRAAIWLMLLTGGFLLTMLGHYGMMLAVLPVLGLLGVWAAWETARKRTPHRVWSLLGAAVAALAGSFALYYWHFLNDVISQWADVLTRLVSASPEVSPAPPPEQPAPIAEEAPHERMVRKLNTLVGLLALIGGAFGALLLSHLGRSARALLLAWLAASALFFLLDQRLGDAVRWYYLAAAAISLLAGRYLALVMQRRRFGPALVWLITLAATVHLLSIWVGDLIFTRYH